MILNYNQFIKEELNVSNKLLNIFGKGRDRNKKISDIGMVLSDLKDKKYDFDFIDLDDDSDDSLTFIPTNKVSLTKTPYENNYRSSVKIGRLTKKILDGLNEEIIIDDCHITIGYCKDDPVCVFIDRGYLETIWLPLKFNSLVSVTLNIKSENVDETYEIGNIIETWESYNDDSCIKFIIICHLFNV